MITFPAPKSPAWHSCQAIRLQETQIEESNFHARVCKSNVQRCGRLTRVQSTKKFASHHRKRRAIPHRRVRTTHSTFPSPAGGGLPGRAISSAKQGFSELGFGFFFCLPTLPTSTRCFSALGAAAATSGRLILDSRWPSRLRVLTAT